VCRFLQVVQVEQVAHDGPVGAAAVLQALGAERDAELIGEGAFECGPARAAAGDKRAVDVEEADVHGGIIEHPERPACHSSFPGSAWEREGSAARGIALRPWYFLSHCLDTAGTIYRIGTPVRPSVFTEYKRSHGRGHRTVASASQ